MFKKRAQTIFTEVCELLSSETTLSLQLNPNGKPSRGSFEIYVQKSSKDDKVNIWSGLKKGPPRKDKFPEVASLMDQIKKALL